MIVTAQIVVQSHGSGAGAVRGPIGVRRRAARCAPVVMLGLALGISFLVAVHPTLAADASPTATPTPPPPPVQASLQVAPTHGLVTQAISVLGQGFAPDAQLALNLDSPSGPVLATAAADGTGFFSVGVTLPASTAPGAHQLLAVDTATGVQDAATLYTVDAAPPPCGGFVISIPLIGNVCIDIGALVTDVLNAFFSDVVNLFGNAWTAVTSPFTPALTTTPNFAGDPAWSAFQTFVTALQVMWGTTFVAMFVFGLFARYLEAIGAGSFQSVLGILGRATMLTAFLALYNPIMANWVFPAENGLATAILSVPISGGTDAFTIIGQFLATLTSVFSFTSLVNLLILILALFVAMLCVVVRDMGLGALAGLYVVGPLCLICWLSPQFDFIARFWVRAMTSLLLWPVGYALALQVGGALLAASGWTDLLGSLGALGCVVLLYRVPNIIGNMASSSTIAGAATVISDRIVLTAQTLVTRAFK
jgi:hypothetical protein